MATDLTAITYFAPIAVFLIVFVVIFAILFKTKLLGESKWLSLFISFLISTLFISAGGAITYIKTITPWFAVLIISLVFLLTLTGFVGKPSEFMNKGIGIVFVIILALVFLISAFIVFSSSIFPYLPGPGFGSGSSTETTIALDYLYSPRIAGAIILIILSAIVSWILVKTK
ncbi:MAG: hypothetical protein ABIG28_00180 [archaeon]